MASPLKALAVLPGEIAFVHGNDQEIHTIFSRESIITAFFHKERKITILTNADEYTNTHYIFYYINKELYKNYSTSLRDNGFTAEIYHHKNSDAVQKDYRLIFSLIKMPVKGMQSSSDEAGYCTQLIVDTSKGTISSSQVNPHLLNFQSIEKKEWQRLYISNHGGTVANNFKIRTATRWIKEFPARQDLELKPQRKPIKNFSEHSLSLKLLLKTNHNKPEFLEAYKKGDFNLLLRRSAKYEDCFPLTQSLIVLKDFLNIDPFSKGSTSGTAFDVANKYKNAKAAQLLSPYRIELKTRVIFQNEFAVGIQSNEIFLTPSPRLCTVMVLFDNEAKVAIMAHLDLITEAFSVLYSINQALKKSGKSITDYNFKAWLMGGSNRGGALTTPVNEIDIDLSYKRQNDLKHLLKCLGIDHEIIPLTKDLDKRKQITLDTNTGKTTILKSDNHYLDNYQASEYNCFKTSLIGYVYKNPKNYDCFQAQESTRNLSDLKYEESSTNNYLTRKPLKEKEAILQKLELLLDQHTRNTQLVNTFKEQNYNLMSRICCTHEKYFDLLVVLTHNKVLLNIDFSLTGKTSGTALDVAKKHNNQKAADFLTPYYETINDENKKTLVVFENEIAVAINRQKLFLTSGTSGAVLILWDANAKAAAMAFVSTHTSLTEALYGINKLFENKYKKSLGDFAFNGLYFHNGPSDDLKLIDDLNIPYNKIKIDGTNPVYFDTLTGNYGFTAVSQQNTTIQLIETKSLVETVPIPEDIMPKCFQPNEALRHKTDIPNIYFKTTVNSLGSFIESLEPIARPCRKGISEAQEARHLLKLIIAAKHPNDLELNAAIDKKDFKTVFKIASKNKEHYHLLHDTLKAVKSLLKLESDDNIA